MYFLHDAVHLRVCPDVNRDAPLQRVEGENSNIIGIFCAIILSAVITIVLILDLASIKESLQLLQNNLRGSDKQWQSIR